MQILKTLTLRGPNYWSIRYKKLIVIRLDLGGMDEMLMVLSGREASVRRLDDLRGKLGDAPAAWYAPLTGKVWPGAAPHSAAAE